ncbi:MAG: hypothetical protein L0Y71_10905 [Gemmataceae bacterium]|nr:hypothetical protein [Gemmataceae bacterium]
MDKAKDVIKVVPPPANVPQPKPSSSTTPSAKAPSSKTASPKTPSKPAARAPAAERRQGPPPKAHEPKATPRPAKAADEVDVVADASASAKPADRRSASPPAARSPASPPGASGHGVAAPPVLGLDDVDEVYDGVLEVVDDAEPAPKVKGPATPPPLAAAAIYDEVEVVAEATPTAGPPTPIAEVEVVDDVVEVDEVVEVEVVEVLEEVVEVAGEPAPAAMSAQPAPAPPVQPKVGDLPPASLPPAASLLASPAPEAAAPFAAPIGTATPIDSAAPIGPAAPAGSATPMLITEILDDDEAADIPPLAADSPPVESPPADSGSAESPWGEEFERGARSHETAPLAAEPPEDAAAEDDGEVHEVENLEVLDYKDDWESCGLLENPAPRLDVPVDREDALRAQQLVDAEAAKGFELQKDDSRGAALGVTGVIGALRLKAERVGCLAYAPDNSTFLAAGDEDLFFLDFDARSGSTSDERMHSAPISSLSISADGRYALSGDEDGGLLLWDTAGKKPLRWLDGHQSEIRATAFAADGLAASGGASGNVRLWKIPSGEMIPVDDSHLGQPVNTVCFSADGRLLLAIGEQGRARLWNATDGKVSAQLAPGPDNPGPAAFNRSGSSIRASSAARFQACEWNLGTGQRRRFFQGGADRTGRVHQTRVTPDGYGLLAIVFKVEEAAPHKADHSEGPSLWVAAGLGPIGIIGEVAVREAAAGVANAAAAIGSRPTEGYFLERWDLTQEQAVISVPLGPTLPTAMACSPGGHRVIVAHEDGIIGLVGT